MANAANNENQAPAICLNCQCEAEWTATGKWRNEEARNRWMLWGCSCDTISVDSTALKAVTA